MRKRRATLIVIRPPWRRWAAAVALLLLCALLLLPAAGLPIGAPAWWPTPVVVIDPGHGGYDPGVETDSGISEKDITLQISQTLAASLRTRGYTVLLTRTDDRGYALPGQRGRNAKRTDLDARIALAEAHRAVAFISIHCNSSPEATRGGAETFFNPSLTGSKVLAQAIQTELRKIPGMSLREAHDGSAYYLLQHLTMPAVIVEAGYLLIPSDRVKLVNPAYQRQVAEAVAAGLTHFLNSWSRTS
ncbi:N-acetylmuramoyl-L-alanine amidase [Kyrpidia sp.]|uniref:N-acetylmuramoyl-L-alanine amidase family protein n=1 Tax=Kyrpidia sp. TaxID=2073077 RepID=UPI0025861217|nr:N-acetylmuramoyl-L-alanine amidase [Kyrpidia sp.]MCL6574517.1 N-acetylmuramoyl-L-alanine amidase [Kyrpidia sp.]